MNTGLIERYRDRLPLAVARPTAIYGPGRTPPGDFFYLPTT